MCGIVGFWSSGGFAEAKQTIHAMADRIAHRGPDSDGFWLDAEAGLAFGHRRLAIIDLSPAGHQPMQSRDDRYVLTYNGEIYNHLAIRTELEALGEGQWRGHSDTETLLAAFSRWGFVATLERLNGMFALALWDRAERKLYLARDRMGEKPLYYGRQGGAFVFASELKALTAHPGWVGTVDRNVLSLFLRHNYVPGPYCIYENMAKLPPAHFLVVDEGGRLVGEPIAYWDITAKARVGHTFPFTGSANDAVDALEHLLLDAVKIRMAADVPLGAFLSGGVDSSTIVALMQRQSAAPVKTYSIGFSEGEYNEAEHAAKVAAHLGTDHTELYVTPTDALSVIPDLPRIWDEPFADSSQIPTYLVSKLARSGVTVSLSGDGGDELFCGYNRYTMGHDMWRRLAILPQFARSGLAGLLHRTPVGFINALAKLGPAKLRSLAIGDRMHKLADVLAVSSGPAFYQSLVSHAKDPARLVVGAVEPATVLTAGDRLAAGDDLRNQMMLLDMQSYLPDDILVKVDRASMAVSLESRVPLLDHRVVEMALAMPLHYKLRDGQSKWALRQILFRHVPRALIERPKMGFGVPIEYWLQGPLRDWADDLLAEDRLRRDGFFEQAPVRKMWEQTRQGERRWHYHVWDILMFQSWLDASRANS